MTFFSCLSPRFILLVGLLSFDRLFLAGASEIVQLLREGESQPTAAGQAGNEHLECHAGNPKPGKEYGLQMTE